MRSIIFASLVALAFAASPAFERTFTPKTEYHYKFDGLILSGLPMPSASQTSQTRISCRARLQIVDDRYIHLQLIKIRLSGSHAEEQEQIPKLESLEERELASEHKELLELPVRASLRNGLVSDIEFDKEDSEWSKNLKRAVLNMISYSPIAPVDELERDSERSELLSEQDNQYFTTNEKTIEGDCEVAYTIVRENKKTIITKSVNFDKCTMRPEISYGFRYTSECRDCQKERETLKPQTVYTYIIENEKLQEVEVRSVYIRSVNGQETQKTETRSKLTYEEEHKINREIRKVRGEQKEELIYSSRWEQLLEDFFKNGDKAERNPFEEYKTEKKMEHIKMIVDSIQENEENKPETAHLLARLVRIVRLLTVEELEALHDTVFDKADKKIQQIIEHSLAIAGTKNTIQHLIKHMEKKDYSPIESAQLLKSIQETPFPSERIADLLVELAKSHVAKKEEVIRQSAWLAAGAVVRGIVAETPIKPLIREDKRELKQKYVRVFKTEFERAETTYEKILSLKTIGNAGIDISVFELNEIIVDQKQPLPIRMEAIDALRLLKDQMPRKIQKILLPVYKNRQYAPELRMNALWGVMNTLPEQPVLAQIVYQMEKESNQQVAAFTYQLIRHFARSTNPCYQRVATECATLLSFTRYQPTEQLLSIYAQLPFFSKDIESGAQFDFAAIFSKDSFLPKELHASLNTVFGGKWNKYFAQIGFSQQHLDQVVLKAMNKLQGLEKETTMVRGRRVQTGLNLLKDLAKKMNIRSRTPVRREKDAHAMVYLRYKDMDYAVLPIDAQMIERLVEKYVKDGKIEVRAIQRLFEQEPKFEGNHAAFFYETIQKVPTTIGFPISLTGKMPTVFSAEGKLSVELLPLEARLTLEINPSLVSTHITEMRMFTPVFEQGIKTLRTVRAYTPIKIEASVGLKMSQLEINYKVVVPENKKTVVSISTRPVALLRFKSERQEYVEAEEKTIVVPQWQQKTQEIEKNYKVLGLEVSVRGHLLNKWNWENVLMCEQDIEYTIENNNRPAEFKARLNIEMLEKTPLREINFEKVFEKEFETEETEKRREYFHKMIREIQGEQGYKLRMTLKLEAPQDKLANAELITICDEKIRMCKLAIDIRRSPMFEGENKEWTLRSELLSARPQMPSSLRQLREQPHREVQLGFTAKWGSIKKNEMTINAQLQQSKEQKQWIRSFEREFNGMPEYELLVKAARLNMINAVAQYKLTPEVESVFARYFELVKAYNFWTVSEKEQRSQVNRVVLQLAVEPMTRQYVNITVQTPEQKVELKNLRIQTVPLPSIAQRYFRQQISENTGSVCKIERNEISTFDRLVYRAPLTTCYSVVAKDCTEEPRYAVLVKKTEKKSDLLNVKVVRGEEEIVLEQRERKMIVKINDKRIPTDELEQYEIEILGDNLVVVRLEEGEVRFDGYTVKTNLRNTYETQICGLCGNNDDETTNEFRTAEDFETEDIEKFHRSYLVKNDECEIEEERLLEKKNYRKNAERKEESSEEYESEMTYEKEPKESKKDLIKKTIVKEFPHRVCFSVEPVAECRRGFESEEVEPKKVKFTCLPRHSSEARRFLKEAREQVLRLADYPVSYVEAVKVPTVCVAY